MENCYSCQNILPDRAVYCPSCAAQVRCKNKECRDMLELGARACVSCGTVVSSNATATASAPHLTTSPAVNVLTFDETLKSRSLTAHLTDAAVDSLSNALGSFITRRVEGRGKLAPTALMQEQFPDVQQQFLPGITQDPSTEEAITINAESVADTSMPVNTSQESVMRFFRKAGDQLHLDDPRLKAANKLDYARRLVYLFLYAHYIDGRDRVPRSELNTVLADSTVEDNNTRWWIRKNSSLVKEDGLIGLNSAGRDAAKIALSEALDPDRKQDWVPGTERTRAKTSSTNNTKPAKASQSSSRTSNRPSVNEWLVKWKAQNAPVAAHRILEKRSVGDKGIFALWVIRDLVGDAGKIVSGTMLSKFILEAFEFKVHSRSLEKALESKAVLGKVLKLKGGYQVQPPGIEYAKQMAKGTTTTNASSAGGAKK